jgi:hypothetical protein
LTCAGYNVVTIHLFKPQSRLQSILVLRYTLVWYRAVLCSQLMLVVLDAAAVVTRIMTGCN